MIVNNSLTSNNNFYKQPTINNPKEEQKWLSLLESTRQNNKDNKTYPTNGQKEKLKVASEQMEAIFVKVMYKSMEKNIPKSGFLSKNSAEDMFSDLLLDERSSLTSKSQSLGLARMVYDQYVSLI